MDSPISLDIACPPCPSLGFIPAFVVGFIPAFTGEARFRNTYPAEEESLYQSHGISQELIDLAAQFNISVLDLMHFDEQTATAGALGAEFYNDFNDFDQYHEQSII